MDKALSDLIRISNITGKDPMLVQGGSGNTSVKTDDGKYMYIKASGTALKDMSAKAGWRRLQLDKVIEIIKDKRHVAEPEIANLLIFACDDNVAVKTKPSIEAPLHALLDKCVIHLHPVVTGAFVSAKNGRTEIEKLFKDTRQPPMWVSFTNSGVALAKRVAKLVSDYQNQFGSKPSVIFLQKHGLFISADSPKAALRLLNQVIKRCTGKLSFPKAGKTKFVNQEVITDIKLGIRKAFYKATGQYKAISYFCDDTIAAFLHQKDAAKMLVPAALTPNELVYTNGPPMWVERWDSKIITERLSWQIRKGKKLPIAFLVKDVGLFVAGVGKITDTVIDTVKSSLIIRINAFRMGGIVSLTKTEQDFINRCETEASQNNPPGGVLQGRIAVVTGAGSGLGKSIAIGLAKAGATVALVDIDKKGTEETVKKIRNPKSEIFRRWR